MYSDKIKKKLKEYFHDRMGMRDYNHGWMKGECPNCGKYKFGIHIESERANCFSCGPQQNLMRVIRDFENFKTNQEVYNLLKVFEGMDFARMERVEQKEIKTPKLPDSFKVLILGDSQLAHTARNYIKGRNLRIMKLSAQGIGYCTRGEYAGHIILPFYQNNKLIYFIGRQFIHLGEKFKNPNSNDFGIGKSSIIYNVDALTIYTKIYVVESVINALTIGNNAIAILGKKISSYQKSMILRSPAKEIILCLDPDAINDTIKLALELVRFKQVKIIQFPDKKDVNDMGKQYVRDREKEMDYLTYKEIMGLRLTFSIKQYA